MTQPENLKALAVQQDDGKTVRIDYEYLHFEQVEQTGKTSRWSCQTHRGEELGEIKWYGPWRAYCYFPPSLAVYSAGCLQDIASFIGQLMKER